MRRLPPEKKLNSQLIGTCTKFYYPAAFLVFLLVCWCFQHRRMLAVHKLLKNAIDCDMYKQGWDGLIVVTAGLRAGERERSLRQK